MFNCNTPFIIQFSVDLSPFGTKLLDFSGVDALWNKKKKTIFDKTRTVKYTRKTHY